MSLFSNVEAFLDSLTVKVISKPRVMQLPDFVKIVCNYFIKIAVRCESYLYGSLQSLEWTSGLDWWTGLVDWTGGLDWWTDIFCAKNHFCAL